MLKMSSSYGQKILNVNYAVKNAEVISVAEETASLRAGKTSVLFEEVLSYSIPTNAGSSEVKEMINQTYKDNQKNLMWALEDTKRVVKEEMNLFKWSFSNEEEMILDYRCRKAKAEFRGRQYEAWFTTELPFKAAPWKIHGLPGVVLKLEVDENYYVLEAISLSVEDSKSEIRMPFREKKSISWEKYVEIYKKEQIELAKYNKSQEILTGDNLDFAYPKIEIIVEKNRETFDEGAKRIGFEWQ
jgi:GLPGLI family protein